MKNERKRCSPERGENRAATSRYLYMYVGEERIVLPSIPRCLLSLPQFYPSSPPIIRTATSHTFPSLPFPSRHLHAPISAITEHTHTRARHIYPMGRRQEEGNQEGKKCTARLGKEEEGEGGVIGRKGDPPSAHGATTGNANIEVGTVIRQI